MIYIWQISLKIDTTLGTQKYKKRKHLNQLQPNFASCAKSKLATHSSSKVNSHFTICSGTMFKKQVLSQMHSFRQSANRDASSSLIPNNTFKVWVSGEAYREN